MRANGADLAKKMQAAPTRILRTENSETGKPAAIKMKLIRIKHSRIATGLIKKWIELFARYVNCWMPNVRDTSVLRSGLSETVLEATIIALTKRNTDVTLHSNL